MIHSQKNWLLFLMLLISITMILPAANTDEDIDEFMKMALDNAAAGRTLLVNYVFTEKEVFEIRQKGTRRLLSSRTTEFVWFENEGELVRSPQRTNGVQTKEESRSAYEKSWLVDDAKNKERGDLQKYSFFNFTYEPGAYFFVGNHEAESGRQLVIEYYPQKHFATVGRDPIGSGNDKYDPLYDKTSLVTFRILPEENQITRIDFVNVDAGYLPQSWIAEFEEFSASMTMQQILDGRWVPAETKVNFVLTSAAESIEFSIRRTYDNYKRARVNIDFETK